MPTIQPIVEGHGEDGSIRTLLDRIWRELLGRTDYLEVRKALRDPKGKLIKYQGLKNAVELADKKLRYNAPSGRPLILILFDADDDLACQLGPQVYATAAKNTNLLVASVLAVKEYETWFVGAATSLTDYLDLSEDEPSCASPERARAGEAWIMKRFRGQRRYSKTTDQPRMTARMDLNLARKHCPSFDKLCRELTKFAEANKEP